MLAVAVSVNLSTLSDVSLPESLNDILLSVLDVLLDAIMVKGMLDSVDSPNTCLLRPICIGSG